MTTDKLATWIEWYDGWFNQYRCSNCGYKIFHDNKKENRTDICLYCNANNEYKKARHIQNIISQVANNRPHHKSYKGCVWTYNID